MSGADSGNLGSYVGAAALKSYINSDLILGELLEFTIPGTQFTGRGMTTEHFELICRGYVQALYEGASLTDRQREIAIKCAVLTAGLTRTGLDALIDEATGYQYDRAEDALQVKLRAFIADEAREGGHRVEFHPPYPDRLGVDLCRAVIAAFAEADAINPATAKGVINPLSADPQSLGSGLGAGVIDAPDPDWKRFRAGHQRPAQTEAALMIHGE